jgi:hypothetical protein
VESARQLTAINGVSGLDLLAYRFDGDVEALLTRVCAAVEKPVVVAGSIDSPERIAAVVRSSAAGFTIGAAAFNGAFSGSPNLQVEIETEIDVLSRNLVDGVTLALSGLIQT